MVRDDHAGTLAALQAKPAPRRPAKLLGDDDDDDEDGEFEEEDDEEEEDEEEAGGFPLPHPDDEVFENAGAGAPQQPSRGRAPQALREHAAGLAAWWRCWVVGAAPHSHEGPSGVL